MPRRFTGAIAALVTPFDTDQNINFAVYGELIDHVLSRKVSALVPVSVSGEFFSLSIQERMDAMRFAAEHAKGRAGLIASTFSTDIDETLKLCHLAADLNFQAAIVSAPLAAPLAPDEILAYFRKIDQQVRLPIIVYNYPGRFLTDITPEIVAALTPSDNFVAYKDTSGRLDRLQDAAIQFRGEIEIICGFDDLAIESYAWGAKSILGGSVCFLAREHTEILRVAVVENDISRASTLMQNLLPLLRLMGNSSKYVQMCKLGCELVGIPVGNPRSPLLPLSDSETARFVEAFSAIGAENFQRVA